jgi:hypothetical protein
MSDNVHPMGEDEERPKLTWRQLAAENEELVFPGARLVDEGGDDHDESVGYDSEASIWRYWMVDDGDDIKDWLRSELARRGWEPTAAYERPGALNGSYYYSRGSAGLSLWVYGTETDRQVWPFWRSRFEGQEGFLYGVTLWDGPRA